MGGDDDGGAASAREAAMGRIATARIEARIAPLVAALADRGVPAIVLKGPSTRLRLYGPDEVRPTADIDLLVPTAGWRRAGSVLVASGYRRLTSIGHADTWQHDDGSYVDLHVTLPYAGREPRAVWRVLQQHTVDLELHRGGAPVPVLDVPAHFVHLAVHAVQGTGPQGRPLDELRRAVACTPAEDQAAARLVAAELDLADVVALALRHLEAPLDLDDLAAQLPARGLVSGGTISFLRSSVSWHERRRALVRAGQFFWSDEWLAVWLASQGRAMPDTTGGRSKAKARRLASVARRQLTALRRRRR